MSFNIGTIFEDVAVIIGDITMDQAELAAGQTVQIPLTAQVGTTGGAPIYLTAALSTTKPSGGLPLLQTANASVEV
jgi:hypothetical protein